MTSFLKNLDVSFGTKSFDPTRKLTEGAIAAIKNAIHATPSSFGLQPYHVVEVRDEEIRKAIRGAAMDQPQITDASHLFVFCARTDIDARVSRYVLESERQASASTQDLTRYAQKVRSVTRGYDDAKALEWATKQTYIALGFALAAAAELGCDSCPIEGFNKGATAKLLGLPEAVRPVVLLALGYHKNASPYKRVRFPEEDLFSSR